MQKAHFVQWAYMFGTWMCHVGQDHNSRRFWRHLQLAAIRRYCKIQLSWLLLLLHTWMSVCVWNSLADLWFSALTKYCTVPDGFFLIMVRDVGETIEGVQGYNNLSCQDICLSSAAGGWDEGGRNEFSIQGPFCTHLMVDQGHLSAICRITSIRFCKTVSHFGSPTIFAWISA